MSGTHCHESLRPSVLPLLAWKQEHSSQALVGPKPTTSALHSPAPHPGLGSRCPKFPLSSHTAPERHSDEDPRRGQPRARPTAERKQAPRLADKATESREAERTLGVGYLPASAFSIDPCVSAAHLGMEEGGQGPAAQRYPPGYLCPGRLAK